MTNGENIQRLPFLDVLVILLQSGNVQTDIFIKQQTATNTSILKAIIQRTLKRTLFFTLAEKKIVQFASSYETEEIRRNLKQPKQHVFICKKNHKLPLFKIYVLFEVSDESLLETYENFIHSNGLETMNC